MIRASPTRTEKGSPLSTIPPKRARTYDRESSRLNAVAKQTLAPLNTADGVRAATAENKLILGDARAMHEVADYSVALAVTSPPYYVNMEYETAGQAADTFADHLDLLKSVFAECFRVLEVGGRIAVNVADLGTSPNVPLPAEVIMLLRECGFLLRGEVVWRKPSDVQGYAWGSFMSASNPTFRHRCERIVVASKTQFDRCLTTKEREKAGLPHENTISRKRFALAASDCWDITPEQSARALGHPAAFPLELPRRLIEFLTYKGDLVLDPFMGSGTTALAAKMTGRRYLGYDIDERYVAMAERRVAQGQLFSAAGDQ